MAHCHGYGNQLTRAEVRKKAAAILGQNAEKLPKKTQVTTLESSLEQTRDERRSGTERREGEHGLNTRGGENDETQV